HDRAARRRPHQGVLRPLGAQPAHAAHRGRKRADGYHAGNHYSTAFYGRLAHHGNRGHGDSAGLAVCLHFDALEGDDRQPAQHWGH
nr:hypothetical protein [Tanacetum cinerariifolium]